MAMLFTYFVIALLSPVPARAGLVLEPFVGGGYGRWSMDRTKSAVEMQLGGTSSNVLYGARLSWTFDYFFVGFDLQYDSVRWCYARRAAYLIDDDWNTGSTAVETGSGAVIGLKTPGNRVSVWLGIFPSNRLKFSADLDPVEPAPVYHGSGTNAGIAVQFTRHLKLGVQYQMKRFSKMGQNNLPIDLPGTSAGGSGFSELKYNVAFAFISVPLEIF